MYDSQWGREKLRHFGALERAEILDWSLMKDHYNETEQILHSTFVRHVPPDDVISKEDLTTRLARATRDRATVPEGLCDDLSAAAPHSMARHLHPLYTRMQLRQSEPLLAKGGVAADVYKNKGTPADIKYYRSILVGSNVTKHHYAYVRTQLAQVIEQMYNDTMCGGRSKRGTTMATHVLRSVLELASATKTSAVIPLYDLKNAYYEVVREMVLPLGTEYNEIKDKMETYGLPAQLKGAVELLLQYPVLTEETCPPHLLSMLVQAHMSTWFTVKEVPCVARAGSGSWYEPSRLHI